MDEIDLRIARLADGQWGVVARRQLLASGISDRALHWRQRTGRLFPVFRGVYSVGHRPVAWESWWMGAVLYAGVWSGLSHLAAGMHRGWIPREAVPIDVTVIGTGGRTQTGNPVVHRSRTLTEDQIQSHRGIPTTMPARTLRDLRPLLPTWQWLRAVNQAEADGMLTRAELDDLFPGMADRTKSELERRFCAICRRHGIPQPENNVVVAGREVDHYWRDVGLAVEIDSSRYHLTTTAFHRDRDRSNDLTLAGVPLLRFTDRRLFLDGPGVAGDVKAARRRLGA